MVTEVMEQEAEVQEEISAEPQESSFSADLMPEGFEEEHLDVARRLWDGESVATLVQDENVHWGRNVLYRIRQIVLRAKAAVDDPEGENGVSFENADGERTTRTAAGQRRRPNAGGNPAYIGYRFVYVQDPAPPKAEDAPEDAPDPEPPDNGLFIFFSGEDRIVNKLLENPYAVRKTRPQYALPRRERWDLYQVGMTLNECIDAGVTRYDIDQDLTRETIIIDGPATEYLDLTMAEAEAWARYWEGGQLEGDPELLVAAYEANGIEGMTTEDFLVIEEEQTEEEIEAQVTAIEQGIAAYWAEGGGAFATAEQMAQNDPDIPEGEEDTDYE